MNRIAATPITAGQETTDSPQATVAPVGAGGFSAGGSLSGDSKPNILAVSRTGSLNLSTHAPAVSNPAKILSHQGVVVSSAIVPIPFSSIEPRYPAQICAG